MRLPNGVPGLHGLWQTYNDFRGLGKKVACLSISSSSSVVPVPGDTGYFERGGSQNALHAADLH